MYARDGGEVYLALVHDIFGHWTLSKGKLQPNEVQTDGAARKVKEEIGLEVKLEEQLGADGARDLVAAMAAPDIPPEIFGAMFPAKGLKDLMNGKIKMQQIPRAPPLAS